MSQAVAETPIGQKPTRVRYIVLAFAATLSMITYLDRACLGSAQSYIIEALHLQGPSDLGWVFAAFSLAYALCEVPSGWLGDVFGPRRVLIRIVICWSIFTALTGLVGLSWSGYTLGLTGLAVLQFLLGMGEAGAFPNLTRALHNWFPYHQRGLAQGTVWMSARLMGGLTPLVWGLLVAGIAYSSTSSTGEAVTHWIVHPLVPWRAAFVIFAGLGVVWGLLFAFWFRDRPEKKPSVNAAELALIRSSAAEAAPGHARVPWLKIFQFEESLVSLRDVRLPVLRRRFHITYLPGFLETQYGVAKTSFLGAIYKGGPLLLGAVGCLLGGFLTDWFIRRTGNRKLGRRLFGIIGHSGCVVCFLLCREMSTAFWFFVTISLTGFCADITMASSWSLCQDIGRRLAAIVAGCMNMIGNLGSALSMLVTGYMLKLGLHIEGRQLGIAAEQLDEAAKTAGEMRGFQIAFLIFAAVHVVSVFCWCMVDSTKPVVEESN